MKRDDEDTQSHEIKRPKLVAEGEPTAMLLILGSGSQTVTGKMFRLVQHETIVGRSLQCDVQLPDDGVSRRHARLTRDEVGNYFLEDLESHNGTFINGEKVVERKMLKPGDKIQIGSTTVLLFAVHDAEAAQFQLKMYEAATHDPLTGLFNRRYLEDGLRKEFPYCNRHQVPLSMLMVDVDHFKKVNDTLGHSAGDFVLCRVAEALLKATRAEDLVARYGGEEFAVLLREADSAGAAICAERCRKLVESGRWEIKSQPVSVTISCGVATLTERNFAKPEALIMAADEALYAAKTSGRNRVIEHRTAKGS